MVPCLDRSADPCCGVGACGAFREEPVGSAGCGEATGETYQAGTSIAALDGSGAFAGSFFRDGRRYGEAAR